MKKPVITTVAAVCMALLTAVLPALHAAEIVRGVRNGAPGQASLTAGEQLLTQCGAVSVEAAQRRVDVSRESYRETVAAENVRQTIENQISRIERGELTYREVFREVYICGDSLMCGLDVVGLINGRHLIAKVSANLTHLEDNLDRLIRAKPRVLILHYGVNAVASNEPAAQRFIKRYGEDIEKIRAGSPHTRIIVSLLFPVDETIATKPRFTWVGRFNELLVEMCDEKGLEYLDTTPLLREHTEFYTADGIHQDKKFYSQYWFPYIMREKEIYA